MEPVYEDPMMEQTETKKKKAKKRSSSKKKNKKTGDGKVEQPAVATVDLHPTGSAKPKPSSGGLSRRLSVPSAMFDLNNKGYLDEEEGILRSYDKNNDGTLDIHEVKKIVADLKNTEKKEFRWRRYSQFAALMLILSVACNFAMVWIALVLTRQVESHNGQLVDKQGHLLSVKSQGSHIVVKPNGEYGRRSLEFRARRLGKELTEEDHREFQRMMEGFPDATVACSSAEVLWDNANNGVTTSVEVSVTDNNGSETTYSATVASGVTHTTNGNGCDEYGGITEVGTSGPIYKLECCCNPSHENYDGNCDVYQLDSEGRRRLCFSPLTLVDVEGKGSIHLQDVQPGDKVLAQGGEYQTLYAFSHYSKTEKSHFLRLTTSKTTLELSDHHMVYLYGKPDPVPASMVKVGDMLIGREQEPLKVSKIGEVVRDGFYHGLTADGTIVANGILASTHASHFGSQEYLIEFWGFKLIHAKTFEHNILERPFRRLCMDVSTGFCNQFATKDEDADITRSLYDRSGNLWWDFCARYNLPYVIKAIVNVVFVLSCNFLATPSLVVGLLLVGLFRRFSSVRMNIHRKKVKSV